LGENAHYLILVLKRSMAAVDIFMSRSTLTVWKAQCFPPTGTADMTLSLLAIAAPIALPFSVWLAQRLESCIDRALWAH